MEGAEVVSRDDERVVFRWEGTAAPPTPEGGDGGTFTTLTVPPDRWLRINATVSWPNETAHVTAEVRNEHVEMCHRHGNAAADTFSTYLTTTRQDICEIRPSPPEEWGPWRVGVTSPHIAFHRQEMAFTMHLEVAVLGGPWSDVEPVNATAWPSLEEARIRPGASIGQVGCTTNFVFRSADNASLYIGTAAHCFDEHDVGVMLTIAGIPNAGRIVYCSWGAMPTHEGPGCAHTPVEDPDPAHTTDNDLLLVEIRPDLHHLVHPAMRHWGGPTGLAEEVPDGTRVLMYGNSSLRDLGARRVPDASSPEQGYVVGSSPWKTCAQMVGPGIPGDSGSGSLTEDGKAFGVLRTLEAPPVANGFVNLAPAIEFLENESMLDVAIATWPLLEQPGVPPSPVDQRPGPPLCRHRS